MKFTVINRWFMPDHFGGIPVYNNFLIKMLSSNPNFHLSIICLKSKKNISFFESNNIDFETINYNLKPSLLTKFIKSDFIKNIIRSYKDYNISKMMASKIEMSSADIVEFMDIHSESYVYLKNNPQNKRKIKVIIRSHTPWGVLKPTYSKEETKGVDAMYAIERERFCFEQCDAISTPSDDLKKQIVEKYEISPDKITVLPNIIDTNHFKILPQRKSEVYSFLHVGRFESAKGVITMIRAFIEVCNETSHNIELINVGIPRGNAYSICMDMLKNANLVDKVSFKGFVEFDQLPLYYSQADAVIVPPKIYESFSYTVAQALACGKPVILSNSGGMPQTVNYGEYGRIFDKESVISLKTEMITQINDKSDNSEDIRNYAIKRFGLQSNKKEYISFYNRVKGL